MTKRSPKPIPSPAVVSSLSLACLGLLAGCGGSSGGGGGSGGGDAGPIEVTAQNAESLARAALEIAVIADSLPASASRYGNAGGQINCGPGTLDISAVTGDPIDTGTSPSGNPIAPPPTGSTLLEYDECLEDGYEKSGTAGVSATGGGQRVQWMNVSLEHALIQPSNVVGAAIFSAASQLYNIDGLTNTQGNETYYAAGTIDYFLNPRRVRFDVQLKFDEGDAQVTTRERMTGAAGSHFDGGEMLISGDDSSVTVIPLGGGLYRLEIDVDGDDAADTVRDAVSL